MKVGGGGGIPSDYLVSTQLQFWLFCYYGWGCRAVTTKTKISAVIRNTKKNCKI